MNCRKNLILPSMLTICILSSLCAGSVSVEFLAGDANGWDFYDVEGDIDRSNVVDWNDVGILANQWLNNTCSIPGWCSGADIDESNDVTFVDYALLAKNWSEEAGEDVLLQTIYGTAQDANGTITTNDTRSLQNYKGLAVAFNVPSDTALDKAIFKLTYLNAEKNIQVRLYNVTDKGYLLDTEHTMPTRTDPGLGGQLLFNTGPVTIPTPAPSHPEGAQNVSDMIINFGLLEVTAGDYFLVFDYIKEGDLSTACNFVRSDNATVSDNMGKYPDGMPLPKRAKVTIAGATGNTYYYQLDNTDATSYSPSSYLFAFQMLTTTVNHSSQVEAGANQTITYPDNDVNLDGTVTDDGLPNPPGAVTTTWTKQSGPGTVTFGNPNAVDTTASFSEAGTYILRLTANDSLLSNYDELTITVNAGVDLHSNCAIHWKMNDNAPSRVVLDSSGNGRHGHTEHNTNTIATMGKINGAFDCSTEEIGLIGQSMDVSNGLSYAIWLGDYNKDFTKASYGYLVMLDHGVGQNVVMYLEYDNDTDRLFLTPSQGSWAQTEDAISGLNVGWHLIILTYSNTGVATITVDNVQRTLYPSSQLAVIGTTLTRVFVSNAMYGQTEELFDNFMLFNRVLTTAEKTFLWNNGNGTEELDEGSVLTATNENWSF